ncbi:MAG: DUF3617 domain-containing protein [Steroidobacter sp.]
MKAKSLTKLLALWALCAVAPLAMAAEKIDIRPGTWEITATTHMSGAPTVSQDLLSKMTPQQRAELEAAFKAEAAKGPQTEVSRECITAEEAERPFKAAEREGCTQIITRTTRTTQEARLVCTGENKGSGMLRVTAPNPETMTAAFELRSGDGPDAMTIKSQMKGRWLTAECEEDDSYDEEFEDEDASAADEYDEPEDEDEG